VVGKRVGFLGVFLLVFAGCAGGELSASALAMTSAASLRSAGTTHIEGSGSLAIRGASSLSFDFTLVADAELPDKSRMRLDISTPPPGGSLETLSVGGHTYIYDPGSGRWVDAGAASIAAVPFGSVDLSAIRNVTEIDRPVVDGRSTRHLRYVTDAAKLLDAMRSTAGADAPFVGDAVGVGELWIRTDDSQIVRQLVKVSFEMNAASVTVRAGQAVAPGKTTVAMTMDMHFSNHGKPIRMITPPPTH
jgi:hypothetical protein